MLTTAGAGVNTLFPVAAQNAGVDVDKIQLTNVAESALVSSYLQGLAPAMLGGMDDKPAEIKANGGKHAGHLQLRRLRRVPAGLRHRRQQGDGHATIPTWCKRFVKATLKAVKEAKANPDAVDRSRSSTGPASMADDKRRRRRARCWTSPSRSCYSPNNKEKRLGLNVPADWDSALDMLKKYNGPEDRPAGERLLHQRVRAGEAG